MDVFDELTGSDLRSLDPDGGVLVVTVYWRPRAKDPNPEQPGEKLFALSYLPIDASDLCRCGSGKRFADCCQPLPYWRPVCQNPDIQGYSLMHSQSACFTNISKDVVYDFLQNDERLYCVVDDSSQHGCWIYWGDPAFDTPYGTLCFGDFELSENHFLTVTALSDIRMKVLLDLLEPLNLGAPQIQCDSFPRLAKPQQRKLKRKHRQCSLPRTISSLLCEGSYLSLCQKAGIILGFLIASSPILIAPTLRFLQKLITFILRHGTIGDHVLTTVFFCS